MKSQSTTVIPIFLIGLLLMVSHGGSSEIYKWKDKNGNIFFSDSPPPPGVDAEIKKFKEEPKGKPKPEVSTPQPKSELPREMRSYGNITVIMYMTSWCGYSRKAREYLQSLNVNLIEYDIEKEMGKREEMLRKSGGSRGVPLIDVEGIIIRGYSPSAIKAAIEKRRGL